MRSLSIGLRSRMLPNAVEEISAEISGYCSWCKSLWLASNILPNPQTTTQWRNQCSFSTRGTTCWDGTILRIDRHLVQVAVSFRMHETLGCVARAWKTAATGWNTCKTWASSSAISSHYAMYPALRRSLFTPMCSFTLIGTTCSRLRGFRV